MNNTIIDEEIDIEQLKKKEKMDFFEAYEIDMLADTIQISKSSLDDTIQISKDDFNE